MNNKIYLGSDKNFTAFLDEKSIKYTHSAQDSLDASTWINLISSGLSLLTLILEFKKWFKEKNKQNNVILNIDKKLIININIDTEETIKQKLETLKP